MLQLGSTLTGSRWLKISTTRWQDCQPAQILHATERSATAAGDIANAVTGDVQNLRKMSSIFPMGSIYIYIIYIYIYIPSYIPSFSIILCNPLRWKLKWTWGPEMGQWSPLSNLETPRWSWRTWVKTREFPLDFTRKLMVHQSIVPLVLTRPVLKKHQSSGVYW